MESKVTILSYYSAEELTGIGKYNGELISWLISNGHKVNSFSNTPFYPLWRKYDGFSNKLYIKGKEEGIIDIRTWVYIPAAPGAIKKIISEFTFFVSASLALLLNIKLVRNSRLFIVILPPFFLPISFVLFKWILNSKLLVHVQDLQVDAAKELKLLPTWLCYFLEKFERGLLNQTDYISTISEGMKQKILAKGVKQDVLLIPNWSNLKEIKPIPNVHWLHEYLGIDLDQKLVVYSGNIGEKQGLEIILEVAKMLESDHKLKFVILGEGLYKEKLITKSRQLNIRNVIFGTLVPKDKINLMLNSSFIQLVIQKPEGADSFFPSKLTGILAAGCISIVTAQEGTTLYAEMKPSLASYVVEPVNSQMLFNSIVKIKSDQHLQLKLKRNARKWAMDNLSINHCLEPLNEILSTCSQPS